MGEENIAEIDSTINDEVTEEVTDVVEPAVQPKKSKSNVAKILEQRNTYKRELEELRTEQKKSSSMEKKLEQLEEMIAGQTLAKEQETEKARFYAENPKVKDHAEGIEEVRKSYENLSYEDATSLYLAKNKPELLADEQFRNKSQASKGAVDGVPESTMKDENDPREMSPNDFLKWSEKMAEGTGGRDIVQ